MMLANLRKTATSPTERVEICNFLPCSYNSPMRGSPWAFSVTRELENMELGYFNSNNILLNIDCNNDGGKDLCQDKNDRRVIHAFM